MNEKLFCLEVWGDMACFTRPELKVERVSYDVITPSAARGIFDAILFKPYAMRWQVTKIEVLSPIRWTTIRRNEVGAVASAKTKEIFIEGKDVRQPRNSLLLRDVRYRIWAKLVFIPVAERPELAFKKHKPGADESAKSILICLGVGQTKGNVSTSRILARVSSRLLSSWSIPKQSN